MKVVSVCSSDWANLMYNFDQALKSVGVESYSFKLDPHPFRYDKQSKRVTIEQLKQVIDHSNFIILFHSDWELLEGIDLTCKTIIPYHTGSKYRNNYELINSKLTYELVLTDQTEFIKIRSMTYMAAAIDTSVPQFGHEIKTPVIAHYPSNPRVKGTELINRVVSSLQGNYIYKTTNDIVTHEDQLKRINDCDIYVELFNPSLGGREYGCFGVTAFEAAAAGKIVVTQNLNSNVYELAYGKCPFILCRTEEELRHKLTELINMAPKELSQLQTDTYNWLKEKHSYEATGKRFLELWKEQSGKQN